MVGARRPAASATSVKRARNGMPEGFPRGEGFTARVAMPCAARRTASSENGTLPTSCRRWRRDRFTGTVKDTAVHHTCQLNRTDPFDHGETWAGPQAYRDVSRGSLRSTHTALKPLVK